MVIGVGGGAEVQHAGDLGQAVASDPTPYHLTGGAWSILDLSAPQSGYAFAQTPDSTPPAFVSSILDMATGNLTITFSEEIDAANVVPASIHMRESGTYTGGVTLTATELVTITDGTVISFALNVAHLEAVAAMTEPELTIDPGAVQDTSGRLIVSTFEASTATFVDAFSVSLQDVTPTGIAFSNDGTKMFMIGRSGDAVHEYALSTPFDVSTAAFVDSFSVSVQEPGPTGMAFSSDGAKMFVVGSSRDAVHEYALSPPFEASTATFVDSFSVSAQDTNPTDIAFSSDGAKMFVIGSRGDAVYEYALSTPFDVSTASFVGDTPISSQESSPEGIAFSNDGAKMFVIGNSGDDVNEYALSTPFDASTATFVDATSIRSQESTPTGIAFSSDGAKMFVIGSYDDNVNEYDLTSVYPIEVTGTYVSPPPTFVSSILGMATGSLAITFSDEIDAANVVPTKIHVRESGTYAGGVTLTVTELDTAADGIVISFTLNVTHFEAVVAMTAPELTIDPGAVRDTYGSLIVGTFEASTATFVDATSISSQETAPTDIAFSSDGARMFVIGITGVDVNEYALSTPFDASTRTWVDDTSISSQESNPQGIAFSSDGTRMFVIGYVGDDVNEYALSTPFDASTRTFVDATSISLQENKPTGIAFSSDGAKMFVVGDAGDDVNEYELSTPFDASTRTWVDATSISSQESTPTGIAFSSDGTRMFVIDDAGDDVNEYELSTPFDASTRTFVDATSISEQEDNPQGIAFSSDGAKMFVIGWQKDAVIEYDLSSVYPIAVAGTYVPPPPTFVSSILGMATGSLAITFSDEIDAANIVPAKIHVRESGNYTHGVTLTVTELDTAADGIVISFTLNVAHLEAVAAMTAPELTIDPGAVRDTSGRLIVSTFEASTASFVTATSISSQESVPTDIAFSSDGAKMFVIGLGGNVNEYELSTPFDASTRTFVDATSIQSQETFPTGIAFSSDGTKMFVVGDTGDDVNEYELSTPFDASTRTFVDATQISEQETGPTDIAFSSDGTKMFVIGRTGDDVNEYALSTPFDASTASFVDATQISAQETSPRGIAFSSDGTKMFVIGNTGDDVNEYALSTPFDVSTRTWVDATSISSQETFPTGIAFSSDGAKMFVVGNSGDDVNEYDLSSVYPIAVTGTYVPSSLTFISSGLDFTTGNLTITFSEEIDAANIVPAKIHVRASGTYADGVTLTATELVTAADGTVISFTLNAVHLKAVAAMTEPELTIDHGAMQDTSGRFIDGTFEASTRTFIGATSISSQETAPTDIAFSSDGAKMFVIGSSGDDVNEYDLSTPFDASTRTFVDATSISSQETSPTGIAFSIDGAKMFVVGDTGDDVNEYALSTPFDASTLTFVDATSISSQESNPQGIAFSSGGTRMFVVGDAGDAVYEYELSTPFDASTRTFVDATSILSQESSPTGIAFSSDGAKMFVIGITGDDVNEYALSTPFDASTRTFVDATSISSQESNPQGIAFSSDGTKMFVIGDDANNVNEYDLTSVYPIAVTGTYVSPPPTFVSSILDMATGNLTITFLDEIDATNIVPAKIHVRESGTYAGGVALTATELVTAADGTVISFTLNVAHLEAVTTMTEPELTIDPGAVQDTSGRLIVGTFEASTATFVDATSISSQEAYPTDIAFSSDGTRMFVIGIIEDDVNEYDLSTPFDVSTRTFVDATSIQSQETFPTGIAFSSDGTKMFVVGDTGDDVNEYALSTPFDASTRTFVDATSISSQESSPTGITFSSDGTKMFVVGSGGDAVYEYTLSAPFDASTRAFVDATQISEQETNPRGIAFSSDGAKMFVVGADGDDVNEYALSTPFDVSTRTWVDATSITSQESNPTGIAFSSDGTRMFVVGNSGGDVNEYDLSSVYPITVTGTYVPPPPTFVSSILDMATGNLAITFSEEINAANIVPAKIHVRETGTYTGGVTLTAGELVTVADSATIWFTMDAAHFVAVAAMVAPELTIDPGAVQDTSGDLIIGTFEASTRTFVDATSISSQEAYPTDIAFSSDGTKMFVIGSDGDDVNEYELSTPFDASTRTFVDATSIQSQETFPTGIAFSSDGTKMFVVGDTGDDVNEYALSTPFDASTRTFVDATSIRSQENRPTDITFSSHGTKMFVIGDAGDAVYEYTLSTPFDASTRTFVDATSIQSQEIVPTDIAFSSHGTKMFVVGTYGNAVHEYDLSTPFDASTRTFVDATSITSQESNPQGIAFSSDGTKMFVIGIVGADVNEYDLSSVYPIAVIGTYVPSSAFVSSILDMATGNLAITFSEEIDAANIVPAKIHVRESGNYTYGVTLTAGELVTTTDGTVISFALNAVHLEAVAAMAVPELTIDPGAVQDPYGSLIVGTFDASTRTFVDDTSISSQDSFPTDIAFSSDGTKMFVVGDTGDDVNEYELSTPFDASTRTFVDATSISSQESTPTGIAFSSDGTRMFVVGSTEDNVNEYKLSTPFDASTRTFVDATSISSQESTPTGIAFSSDGTRMFVVGSTEDNVNEYELSTPFDASTRTFVDATSISSQESTPTGIAFSIDGAKMFVIGITGDDVNEYALSTPFDASTLTFVDATSITLQESSPQGIAFSSDGAKMFVIGDVGDDVNEYDLSSVYPIAVTSTYVPPPAFVSSRLGMATGILAITFSEEINAANIVPASIHVRESGTYTGGVTLTAGELVTTTDGTVISFVLNAAHLAAVAAMTEPELTIDPGAVQDTSGRLIVGTFDASTRTFVDDTSIRSEDSFPTGIAFSIDGAKMFVIGTQGRDVNEYELSTPFDASTRTFVDATSISEQETTPQGIAFSSDGTRMFVIGITGDDVNEYALSTPFDASTLTFVDATSISSQESNPQGIAFSSDGAKMFVIGSDGDDVNEYELSTPFDASTRTFVDATSILSQESSPTGIAFSSDGAKMFVVGIAGDSVYEYELSTPFDASTRTFVDATSISSQESNPQGIAFSSDGTKMFVIGSNDDNVNEYDLSSVYPIAVTGTYVQPPPTFVSSGLDFTTGNLAITFSEEIDAANVVPAKIHVRETGTYTGGVTLTAGELVTIADSATIRFTLNAEHLAAVAAMTESELTIDPGAVQDTSGSLIVGTFEASTATFVDATSITSQEFSPTGIAFSSDGTKMFVIGNTGKDVNEYNLSTPFDVSTRTFVDATSISEQETYPTGIAFSSDGAKMFVIGKTGDDVNEYELSTPFDASTRTFVDATSISSQESNPTGIAFSSDGTKMFVVGIRGGDVNEYELSTPFDASTLTFVGDTPISSQESSPEGIAFSSDGTKMFVIGNSGDDVNEYKLRVPFEASTRTFVGVTSIFEENTIPTDIAFSNDGAKMFVIDNQARSVNEYDLSSAYPIVVTGTYVPPPPTFASSILDMETGNLAITFLDEIDATPAANIVPAKIHVRESGTYTGGVALTATELVTTTDGTVISFTLNAAHLKAVAAMVAPELTIAAGAVQDTSGRPIIGTFEASTRTFVGATSISEQEDTPTDIAFSSDGIKMLVVGADGDDVNEYELSAPFDVSTRTWVDATSISEQETNPRGIAFSSDGTKMFVIGITGGDVNEYELSAPFDVSTRTWVDATSISEQETAPTGIAFSSDGTKMFVIGDTGDDVNEYELSAPFDASTRTFVDATPISAQETLPTGIAFSSDGAKMFVIGDEGDDVNEYALSAPFDASTRTFVDATSIRSEDSFPTGIAFSIDGAKMFVIGDEGDDVNEYALSSVYPIEVAGTYVQPPLTFISSILDFTTRSLVITFSEEIDVASVVPAKIHVRESGTYTGGVTLTAGEHGTVADSATISLALNAVHLEAVAAMAVPELTIDPGAVQDTSGRLIVGTFETSTATFVDATSISAQEIEPRGIAFSSDGAKMFVIGLRVNTVIEYDLSTPFDASTRTHVDVITDILSHEILPTDVEFSSDGTKMFVIGWAGRDVNEYALSTPFDTSTAVFVDDTSISEQENKPTGIAFSSDGTKMFVIGDAGNDVNEYELSAPFDASTRTFVDATSISAQETLPTGIAFSSDGAKMFVIGYEGDDVNEYALSAPFDVSTRTFVSATSISAQEIAPWDIAFSSDGAKMFVIGDVGDDVNEYDLSSVYPIAVTGTYVSPPPTFVSSILGMATGSLEITFSDEIDAANVVPASIHVRESGTYTGGVTLTAGELVTTTDGTVISFALNAVHLEAVAAMAVPELTIDPGAVRDTYGSLIVGTFDVSTASFVDATSISSQESTPTGIAFSSDGTKMFVVGWQKNAVIEYELSTPFDASTRTWVDDTSISEQEDSPTDIAFSSDGTRMFVIGDEGDDVNEYALSTPFDASTRTFVDATSIQSQETLPTGIAFSSDGTRMFVIGDAGDDVNEYALSTPFDASTRTFVDATSISEQETFPTGIVFSSDGTKMFVVGDEGDDVNEYALSAPFDASTRTFVDATSISSQETLPTGIAFSSDGAKMFVIGDTGKDVNEYDLTSVYPIAVISTYVPPPAFVSSRLDMATGILAITFSEEIDVASVVPASIHMRESGTYTGGVTLTATELVTIADGTVISFALNAVHLEAVAAMAVPELTIDPGAVQDTSGRLIVGTFDASTRTFVDVTQISEQETDPTGIAFSSDGTKMFVIGADGDDVNEYALSAPFDASTRTFVDATSISEQETLPTGIAFSSDGTKMFVVGDEGDDVNEYALSAPFDASTRTFVDVTQISEQETLPTGIAFSSDGTKMFVIGADGDDVNEYALSAPFDASTRTFVDVTQISEQETAPTGIAFSSDGTKMFVVGDEGDDVNEYALSAPFDASTRTFVDATSISSQESIPTGIAFSIDGAKMFVIGWQKDAVIEYDLTSVYPIAVTGNVAPVLNTIGDQTVNEFVELTFAATASDDDALTFSLDGTVPSGAVITSAGVFTWTPTESQDGDHTITVQVTDGSLTDSETLTVTVNEVNVAPALNTIGDRTVNEFVELTFTATALDTDVVDKVVNTLTFSLDGTVPSGAVITSAGVFTWTPTESQVGPHDITVQVTDGSLTDSETLTVTVKDTTTLSDNADLGSLTISSGTLSPQFSSSDITYTASVDNSVTQVTVTPTASDSSATITVNDNTVTSGTGHIVTGLNVGTNTVTVIVTAQDSTTKTYTITLTRAAPLSDNADLGGLTISSGTLSPQFSSSDITYTASVDNSVTQVTVTPTASDSSATITVNDNTVTSGTGHIVTGLNVGTNTVTVIVTAQDSTTKTYTITLTRAAPLSDNADLGGLTISSGTLSPQFSSSDITYTASVDNSVTQVTVTPTASDSSATITVNDNTVTSGTGHIVTGLTVGDTNTVTVIVTAQDSTTKTYTITLTRAAHSL